VAETAQCTPIIVVLMGTMTGVAGGILRDVITAQVPLILQARSSTRLPQSRASLFTCSCRPLGCHVRARSGRVWLWSLRSGCSPSGGACDSPSSACRDDGTRTEPNNGFQRSASYGFAGKVDSSSDRNVGMVRRLETSMPVGQERVAPQTDLGGWSGGRVFQGR
jgi:hypothetical protein